MYKLFSFNHKRLVLASQPHIDWQMPASARYTVDRCSLIERKVSVTGSWFLERHISAEFLKWIILGVILVPQAGQHASQHPIEISKTQQPSPEQSSWINSTTGKMKDGLGNHCFVLLLYSDTKRYSTLLQILHIHIISSQARTCNDMMETPVINAAKHKCPIYQPPEIWPTNRLKWAEVPAINRWFDVLQMTARRGGTSQSMSGCWLM